MEPWKYRKLLHQGKNEKNGIAEAIPFLSCPTMFSYREAPFTLRFNEGDPIHETAIGLLELQSPRTKAQYVANAVVYYNEHFGQEPQPLNASIISKEAVVAIVKEILRQEGMGQEKAKEQAITARLVEGPVAPVMPSTAQEVDDDSEMDDRTRRLIAGALSAFRSRG